MRGLSISDSDPQTIWAASYLTSSTKTKKLYDLTNKIAESSGSSTKRTRSVCITYGGWTSRSIYEATSWFVRNLQASRQKSPTVAQPVSVSTEKTINAAKRRKLRVGKQMDVGSLLGAFK
jgi:hypothetical protein